MRITKTNNVAFMAILMPAITMVFVAILALTQDGAKAEPEHNERMTSYQAPTGVEMTPEAATDLVVRRFARQSGGVSGAMTITTVHSTFAQAEAVVEGKAASEAVYGGPPDIAEWRASSVYMVTMRSEPGEVFRPNVSSPRGQSAPAGSVMTVIVDSHTGFKEGLDLAPTAPSGLGELGPAYETSVPATSAAAMAALRRVPLGNVGELQGHVYFHNHPVVGWHVIVGHKLPSHITAKGKTYSGGLFGFRVAVGRYQIAVRRPSGVLCGMRKTRITYHKETEIRLNC